MNEAVTVCVGPSEFDDGTLGFGLKLQSTSWEVNILLTEEDLSTLPAVRNAKWNDRGSKVIGTVEGAKAHWSCEGGKLSILIGHDDETWNIGFWMPELVLVEIETEIARERADRH